MIVKINRVANSVYNQSLGIRLQSTSLWVALLYLEHKEFGRANDHECERCPSF